jgi:serine/threonine protein kinase
MDTFSRSVARSIGPAFNGFVTLVVSRIRQHYEPAKPLRIPFHMVFIDYDLYTQVLNESSARGGDATGRVQGVTSSVFELSGDLAQRFVPCHRGPMVVKVLNGAKEGSNSGKNSATLSAEYKLYERLYAKLNASDKYDWHDGTLPVPRLVGYLGQSTDAVMGIVYESLGRTTLRDYLRDWNFTRPVSRQYFTVAVGTVVQVAEACEFLQTHMNIAHRDIHAKNVMLLDTPHNSTLSWPVRARLIDMQLAELIGKKEPASFKSNNLPADPYVSDKTDVYSIGLLMSVFLFRGKSIYHLSDDHDARGTSGPIVLKRLNDCKTDPTFINILPHHAANWNDFMDVMRKCLEADAEKRISLYELRRALTAIQHPLGPVAK